MMVDDCRLPYDGGLDTNQQHQRGCSRPVIVQKLICPGILRIALMAEDLRLLVSCLLYCALKSTTACYGYTK